MDVAYKKCRRIRQRRLVTHFFHSFSFILYLQYIMYYYLGYMCQINTMPMKSQIGYLDVTGR